jgi:hypothetical protein
MDFMDMTTLLAHPVVVGALSGFLTAARVDYIAFQRFQTPEEAAQYQWRIALWRWLQGAVIGAVTARELGLGV